jgi:hypothetical protein
LKRRLDSDDWILVSRGSQRKWLFEGNCLERENHAATNRGTISVGVKPTVDAGY